MVITYNKLVRSRNKVRNAFAQIETHLQRRFDLIPNLVETVKGYQIHEKQLLENVAACRSGYLRSSSPQEKVESYNDLNSSLRKLFAITEAYPDLKANTSFLMLQQELSGTEDKLTYARQFYNDAVTIYNDLLLTFPNNIIGAIFGFKAETLFDAVSEADTVPQVRF
jgi:LemA protein